MKCTELCGGSGGYEKKMKWHVIHTSLEMILQKSNPSFIFVLEHIIYFSQGF